MEVRNPTTPRKIQASQARGKSAVIAALVSCLGAGVRFSKRGDQISQLVKTGKPYAVVRVKLNNEGPEAYKPDLYGRSLTVERRITSQGSSQYKVKSERGETHSFSRKELDILMDRFAIQIDNPCTILMQETSKTFLCGKKPSQHYELFLRSTQLDMIKTNLEESVEHNRTMNQMLETKKLNMEVVKTRLEELKSELKVLKEIDSQRSSLQRLRGELVWAHVKELEDDLRECQSRYDKSMENVKVIEDKLKELHENVLQLSNKSSEKRKTFKEAMAEITDLNKKKVELRATLQKYDLSISSIESDLKHAETEIGRFEVRYENMMNTLERVKSTDRREEEMATRERTRNEKQSELEKVESLMVELNTELEDQTERLKAKKRTIDGYARQLRELEALVNDNKRALQKIEGQIENRSRAFLSYAPEFQRILDENRSQFSRMPLGPLGVYMTLLDESWSMAVDVCCGTVLGAYVVHVGMDAKLVQSLCEMASIRTPTLIVMDQDSGDYQIPENRLPDASLYRTVSSVISVEHSAVRNALIDYCSIESKILLPDLETAKRVMFSVPNNSNPANVSQAVTRDGCLVYWSNGTQLVRSANKSRPCRLARSPAEQIPALRQSVARTERQIAEISRKERAEIDELRELERKQAATRPRQKRLLEREVELKGELEYLERAGIGSVDEGGAEELENVAERLKTQIAEKKAFINSRNVEKEEVSRKRALLSDELQLEMNRLKELSTLVDSLAKELDEIDLVLRKSEERSSKYMDAIKKLGQMQVNMRGEISEKKSMLDADTQKASGLLPRPEGPIPSVEEVRLEIQRVELTISNQQQRRRSINEVIEQYRATKETLNQFSEHIEILQALSIKSADMIAHRYRLWKTLRTSITQRTRALFVGYLSQRGFSGQLVFDHKKKTLDIFIDPSQGNTAQDIRAHSTHTLSGGERSYATVSFLLSLWECVESPFRIMDEFDVFMDDINRKISTDLIISSAKEQVHRQYLFLMPNLPPSVSSDGKSVKILQLSPPERA